jgi:hypothetical protein
MEYHEFLTILKNEKGSELTIHRFSTSVHFCSKYVQQFDSRVISSIPLSSSRCLKVSSQRPPSAPMTVNRSARRLELRSNACERRQCRLEVGLRSFATDGLIGGSPRRSLLGVASTLTSDRNHFRLAPGALASVVRVGAASRECCWNLVVNTGTTAAVLNARAVRSAARANALRDGLQSSGRDFGSTSSSAKCLGNAHWLGNSVLRPPDSDTQHPSAFRAMRRRKSGFRDSHQHPGGRSGLKRTGRQHRVLVRTQRCSSTSGNSTAKAGLVIAAGTATLVELLPLMTEIHCCDVNPFRNG